MRNKQKASKGQTRRGRPSVDPRLDARRALKRALREQREIARVSRQLEQAVMKGDAFLFNLAKFIYDRNAEQAGIPDRAVAADE